MSQTILHAGGTITPLAVTTYLTSREAGTIIHPILGRSNPDVTLRPAMTRTGTLVLAFTAEADAKEAEDAHAAGGVFSLTSDSLTTIEMYYVANGRIERELADGSTHWIVRVDFQEIAP